MRLETRSFALAALASRPRTLVAQLIEREVVFGWLLIAPAVLFLAAFLAYPLGHGVYLSLQDRVLGRGGSFVGVQNFVSNFQDPVFWQVARNTFVYTGVATIFKLIGGLALALVINQRFPLRNLVRASLLLPWVVPTVLSVIAWMWIFDSTFGVINWMLTHSGLVRVGPSWLGNGVLAMAAIIAVNVWRGLPFYGITLLAALQTVPSDLLEAAAIDGASARQRFAYVTFPFLTPVLLITTMFSIIWTFSDFQLVYVLTGGGPANATHLFATYAFNVAMMGGRLSEGAAIAVTMFPPLALLIAGLTFYLRRM